MIKLSDLQKRTRVITVEYQGDKVEVTYLVNVITPGFLTQNDDLVSQVKAAVVEWDIVDGEGKRIAPEQIVSELPVAFLNAVLAAIVEDMRSALIEKKD